LRNNRKSGIEWLYKNPKSPENTLNNEKKHNLLKPKECKYQNTTYVGARFLPLACQGGRFAPVRGDGCHPFVMPLIRCISNMNSHNFFW